MHAYSALSVFTLKWDDSEEDVILMRNPWGETNYRGEWSKSDSRWTDELVK